MSLRVGDYDAMKDQQEENLRRAKLSDYGIERAFGRARRELAEKMEEEKEMAEEVSVEEEMCNCRKTNPVKVDRYTPNVNSYRDEITFEEVDPWNGKDRDFRFNEIEYVHEIEKYIVSTYGGHYSREKFQATEFIYDGGHGTGFNIGNVLKYAQRYGKKGTRDDARKDLMKVIHYAILQLYVHDQDL